MDTLAPVVAVPVHAAAVPPGAGVVGVVGVVGVPPVGGRGTVVEGTAPVAPEHQLHVIDKGRRVPLDEAALQEIVRQMIREELQGSLGERITRTVRKLVRTEINRALVARDLD